MFYNISRWRWQKLSENDFGFFDSMSLVARYGCSVAVDPSTNFPNSMVLCPCVGDNNSNKSFSQKTVSF